MFENGVYLSDFKDELKKKFNYPEELAQEIVIVTEDLVAYFGSEYIEAILSAVKDTKVVLVDGYQKKGIKETVATVLEREGMSLTIEGEDKLSLSEVRSIESVYVEKPIISCEQGGFKVENVKRVAVINNPFIKDSLNFRSMLIRELSTAVTAHLNSYSITGDEMIIKRGLERRIEKLTLDSEGNVQRTFKSSTGYGLENAVRDYDKLGMTRFYDDKFDLKNHHLCVLVAGTIMDAFKLREQINMARVTKDDSELRSILDGNIAVGFDGLMEALDNLYTLEKQNITLRSGDRNAALESADKLENYYHGVVEPMVRNLKASLKIDISVDGIDFNGGNTI